MNINILKALLNKATKHKMYASRTGRIYVKSIVDSLYLKTHNHYFNKLKCEIARKFCDQQT